MDTADVTRIIQDVKAGRKEDFLQLVEQFEHRVRAFTASRCPDRHLVDDLVQSVFVFAYQHLEEFQEGTNFLAWLMTVARLSLLAEFRAQERRAKAHNRYVEYIAAGEAVRVTADEQEADDTRGRALEHCLGSLQGQARDVMDMRYRAAMTIQEICDRLGRTLSWGKSFLARLKKSLRECMENRLAEGT